MDGEVTSSEARAIEAAMKQPRVATRWLKLLREARREIGAKGATQRMIKALRTGPQ